MSDVAAPAAPAAAPQSSTAAAPVAQPAKTPAGPATGRSPGGQFLPKEGTQGAEKPPAAQQQPGETKEEFRLRRELKVFGKTEKVDYGEEDLVRELQISRARAKKLAEMEAKLKEREELDRLAEAEPVEFLKRKGHDPDALAKQRLLAAIEQEAMSPEQRELAELRAKLSAQEAEQEERTKKEKEALRELKKRQLQVKRKEEYRSALAKVGLEDQYEALFLMGETESLMREEGLEVNPDTLVKETQRRIQAFTKNYLSNLTIPSLIKELGQERIQALLEHTVAEFEKSHGIEPVKEESAVPAVSQDSAPNEFITEEEWERRMRERRRKASGV